MPRHQKFPAPTWVGPRHHRASPAHPTRAGLQSQWFEVAGRLPERGRIHPRSNWPCSLRGRPLHDRRSSTFDTHRRRVADRREPALHKAGESALPRASGFAQDRIPRTSASICLSVSIPPALCAKAGIGVPGTPFAAVRRITASSAMARKTGFARAMAAPPLPFAPWHPAQFCP